MWRPEGILRFETDASGEAHGKDAIEVDYEYTIELPREKVIAIPDVADQSRRELERRRGLESSGMGGGGMGGGGFGN